ncbi:hypothetical protein PM082_016569 [Marasmius tenuissimus]|nr:hypothetical protein PM082_016569 [Marasmius tenuissimus]
MSPSQLVQGSEPTARAGFNLMVVAPLLFNSVHLFLYGLYVLLYRIGLLVLKKRPRTQECLFHQVSLHVLFVLVTLSIPIALAFDLLQISKEFYSYSGLEPPVTVERAERVLGISRMVLMCLQGGMIYAILIFRCYVLWEYRHQRYISVPIVACTILILGGTSSAIAVRLAPTEKKIMMQNVCNTFLALIALSNLILTGTIALRIWMTIRVAGSTLSPESRRKFSAIIAIVFESGLLYVLGMIVMILVATTTMGKPWDIVSIMITSGGILPTLVIVRANTLQGYNQQITVNHLKMVKSGPPVEREVAVESIAGNIV